MQIINKVQKTILQLFGGIGDSDQFYLTGGTALSYFYTQHRTSKDLDFFTPVEELVSPFGFRLQNKLASKGMIVERRRTIQTFVEFLIKFENESTILQLAQDAAFHFEAPKNFPEYPKLKVDSLSDIASNKILALFGRAALRDFIDVYFLITKGHFKKEELIDKAFAKDPGFDLYWLGVAFEQLKTFDAHSPEMHLLLEPLNLPDLVNFFLDWKREIKRILQK
ncbi:MAG: nucleotidyl transferase AbiEii/AbiGii toxin family protein [Candidatus Omnitrophica bacterium]|nr:nucleotidyl transferase AbiEii/AbiGii toxin family protein [Candidatus Omnitrophota bacterium]